MEKVIINNMEFAKSEQHMAGHFELATFSRLAEFIEPAAAIGVNVNYELVGEVDTYQYPSLTLKISAQLPMKCQRCLELMSVPIHLGFDYVITHEAYAELDESDDVDWLEPVVDMNLQELIEDELLIALPIAPMHQELCKQLNTESGAKPNPFAALKGKV